MHGGDRTIGLVSLVLAAGLLLAAAALGPLAPTFSTWLPLAVAIQVVGGALVAVVGTRSSGRLTWPIGLAVVLVALACRALTSFAPHDLSDDAYRYAWDGRVWASGINPYLHEPTADAVAHLRGPADDRINHPDVVTVYPPLAQLAFRWSASVRPSAPLDALRTIFALGEVVAWLIVGVAAARRGLPWTRFLLVAWFPLVWVQGYAPGHTDVWGLPWIAAFGVAVHRRHVVRAGVGLALAALVKPIALAFVPGASRHMGWRRTFASIVVAGLVGLAAYVPFLSAGERLGSSAELMARSWSFNGSLGALAAHGFGDDVARPLLLAAMAIAVSWVLWRRRPPISTALLAFTVVVSFTTTLYPWYLTWMFPLLVFVPDPALLTLAATVALADLVNGPYQSTGAWEPSLVHTLGVYVPFYVVLAVGAVRRWGMFGAND